MVDREGRPVKDLGTQGMTHGGEFSSPFCPIYTDLRAEEADNSENANRCRQTKACSLKPKGQERESLT